MLNRTNSRHWMIDLAFKDLVQVARDRKSAVFLVVMPVLFTLALGIALSGSAKQAQVKIGWVNQDRVEVLERTVGKLAGGDGGAKPGSSGRGAGSTGR